MKTIIRLTETDLKGIIEESVKRVIKEHRKGYRSGYVGHDGNHIVGGKWWSSYSDMTAKISGEQIADILSDSLGIDEETFNTLYNALEGKVFYVDGEFESGEDESVGIPQYCNFEDVTNYDGLDQVLQSILGPEQAEAALGIIFNSDNVDNYNWQGDDGYE